MLTDPDGLPSLYDDALGPYVPTGPRTGAAQRFVEAGLADGLTVRLADAYSGDADCALAVGIENVILPDRTRFTPLSGRKSFLVAAALTAPDGTVLAETTRPFTVIAPQQKLGRTGRSAWSRIGNTADLRAEALDLLTLATADVVADAFAGGRTQTGLSGQLTSYPERIPPSAAE